VRRPPKHEAAPAGCAICGWYGRDGGGPQKGAGYDARSRVEGGLSGDGACLKPRKAPMHSKIDTGVQSG
jgi:hypothetical protein